MLQQTVARIEPLVPADRILVITGADQAEATRAQLPDLPAAQRDRRALPRATRPRAWAWRPASSPARPGWRR